MTKIIKNGSAPRQMEYAKARIFSNKRPSKKRAALRVGYSLTTANSAVSKIESKPGYINAVSKLSNESQSLALDIMAEFKRRKISEFSDKNLIGALNAIGNAWAKFNAGPKVNPNRDGGYDSGKNPLRTVILQRVENQTISAPAPTVETTPLPDEDPGF